MASISYGQSVGIRTPAQASTAMLYITSINKGLLIIFLTIMQRTDITTTAKSF
jgi:hypothetical protein